MGVAGPRPRRVGPRPTQIKVWLTSHLKTRQWTCRGLYADPGISESPQWSVTALRTAALVQFVVQLVSGACASCDAYCRTFLSSLVRGFALLRC